MTRTRSALATLALAGALALTGCTGTGGGTQGAGAAGGTQTPATATSGSSTATGTTCTLNGCTVVLQRGVNAQTSVFGIPVEVVGTTGNQLTARVAGQQVNVPLDPNSSASVAGLTVRVQSADAERIVLEVTR